MFTLQDCSVCFEDFDNERPPHSIPCGHVFCSPCLESLVTTSPTCPNCRVSYSSSSIRKVVCAQQDSAPNPQPNRTAESEAETLMWQAIQSSLESPMEIRQRRLLVEHNPEEAMKDAGLSVNLLTAFNVMRLLVKVEKSHSLLQDKLNTAQAVEQSLCDRISTLEAQSVMNIKPASSSDLQSLLAEFQSLRFVVESIDKKTSDIATRMQPAPAATQPTPAPIETTVSPASVPIPPTPLEPARPALLRKPSPRNTTNTPSTPTTDQRASFQPLAGPQHQRYPSTPILTGKQPLSPPPTPNHGAENSNDQSLFGATSNVVRRSDSYMTNNPGRASTFATPVNSPPPKYQQTITAEPPNPAAVPLSRSRTPSTALLSSPTSERALPSTPTVRNRTSAPLPTPIPVPTSTTISPPPAPSCSSTLKSATAPTLIALHDFSADSDVEHSLKQGEKLYASPQADLEAEWIWCKNAAGKPGYVPKCYVKVEGSAK